VGLTSNSFEGVSLRRGRSARILATVALLAIGPGLSGDERAHSQSAVQPGQEASGRQSVGANLQIIVRQTYNDAPNLTFAVGPMAARLLRAVGINAVVPPSNAVDPAVDTLTINVRGTGLGGDYGSAGFCFTGAEVSGELSLQSESRVWYEGQFQGRLPPARRIINCRGRSPVAAPFANAILESNLLHQIADMVRVRYGDGAVYDYWMGAFGDATRRIRLKGLEGLGDVADPRALQTLLNNLDLDDRWDVVVDALAKHGTAAVEPLVQVLEGTGNRPFDPARAAAADALGRIGGERAKGALTASFNDQRTRVLVKLACAAALLRLGDPSMIDVLIRTLHNTEIGSVAVKLLGKSGDTRGVGPLIDYLRENASLEAFEALTKLTGERFGNNRPAWISWWEANQTRESRERK
jgi:hypothetical protein